MYENGAFTTKVDILARTSGLLSSMILSFLIIPVAKNSIIMTMFRIPFEQTVKVHRWIAYLFLACTVVHMFSMWGV